MIGDTNKRQLLCTFSSIESFNKTIEEIKKFYKMIYNNRFFVFFNANSIKEIFITYNIISNSREFPKFPNTISIHRKKETNSLFTINALNALIKDENGGVFDKSFSVDWSLYNNSLIITGNPSVKIIPIKILEIVG